MQVIILINVLQFDLQWETFDILLIGDIDSRDSLCCNFLHFLFISLSKRKP